MVGTAQCAVQTAAVAQAGVLGAAQRAVPTIASATTAGAPSQASPPTLPPCACHRHTVGESLFTSRHSLTSTGLPALASSSNPAQPSLSIEQIGLIFHGFSASRPTKQDLLEESRALKADAQRQQMVLLQARVTAASSAACWNTRQAQHQCVSAVYAALKRGCMMRDMQAMVSDYL